MTVWIISTVVNTLLKGLILWGLLKIFDRDNTRNTLSLALFLGLLMSLPFVGFFCIFALGYMLIQYYELDFGQMIVIILLLIAAQWGIGRLFIFTYNAIQ